MVEVAWETIIQLVNKHTGPEILACPDRCGGDLGRMRHHSLRRQQTHEAHQEGPQTLAHR